VKLTAENLAVSADCRDMRHRWERVGDYILIEERGQVRHFKRRLVCDRCGTTRTDEYKISRSAIARVKSYYEYVEGYQIKGGAKVADVRFIMFSQMPMVREDSV
jgi:hypothetical protein